MANLRSVLLENFSYYEDLEKRIKNRLLNLPSGSILLRYVGRHQYYYLKIRQGKKVVSKYLGKKKPIDLINAIQERKLLEKQLKETKQSLRLLNKIKKK